MGSVLPSREGRVKKWADEIEKSAKSVTGANFAPSTTASSLDDSEIRSRPRFLELALELGPRQTVLRSKPPVVEGAKLAVEVAVEATAERSHIAKRQR